MKLASLCLILSLFAFAQDSPDPTALPYGFYYKTAHGWQKLEPTSMAGAGAKHVGKMLVPGLTPQIVWTFRGAEAPVQLDDKRPTFCIKENPQLLGIVGHGERDIAIVRFDKKKDHRELQVSNGGNMLTYKAGIGKDHMPDISTKAIADGVFLVAPSEDLKPGEYLLTLSTMANTGYDFGVK